MDVIKRVLVPFANRSLLLLYYSRAISLFGTVLSGLAIPLYIYHETGDGQIMAFTSFSYIFGSVIAGLFLSYLADTFTPKHALIMLEALSGALIGFLYFVIKANPTVLYLITFFLGACATLFLTSSGKLLSLIETNEQPLRTIIGMFAGRFILTSVIITIGTLSFCYLGLAVLKNIWLFIFCYALGDFVNSIYIIHTDSLKQFNNKY
jgi:MFS family permease